jgi:hypothetical protein
MPVEENAVVRAEVADQITAVDALQPAVLAGNVSFRKPNGVALFAAYRDLVPDEGTTTIAPSLSEMTSLIPSGFRSERPSRAARQSRSATSGESYADPQVCQLRVRTPFGCKQQAHGATLPHGGQSS